MRIEFGMELDVETERVRHPVLPANIPAELMSLQHQRSGLLTFCSDGHNFLDRGKDLLCGLGLVPCKF